MDAKIKQVLKNDQWIDITTLGRKTGQHRRIEIGIHNVAGEYYITGTPGKRGWYANVSANAEFIVHIKESMQLNLRAAATSIRDVAERRKILTQLLPTMGMGAENEVEDWVASSALIRVKFIEE